MGTSARSAGPPRTSQWPEVFGDWRVDEGRQDDVHPTIQLAGERIAGVIPAVRADTKAERTSALFSC